MTSNLVVLTFDGAGKAEAALDDFQKLQDKGLLTIDDAVVAYRYPKHSDPPPVQTQVGQGYMAGTDFSQEQEQALRQALEAGP